MPESGLTVTHNVAQHRFEARAGDTLAHCDYQVDGTVMQVVHTEVPAALEGRGIAAKLVAAALSWARAEGLSVVPICSYVRAYMRRHPETTDLLADGVAI